MDVAEVLLMVGLCLVALMGRHVVLYLGAFTGMLLWGLGIADTNLMMGLAIILIGCFFLYRSYEVWFGR